MRNIQDLRLVERFFWRILMICLYNLFNINHSLLMNRNCKGSAGIADPNSWMYLQRASSVNYSFLGSLWPSSVTLSSEYPAWGDVEAWDWAVCPSWGRTSCLDPVSTAVKDCQRMSVLARVFLTVFVNGRWPEYGLAAWCARYRFFSHAWCPSIVEVDSLCPIRTDVRNALAMSILPIVGVQL